MQNIKPNTTSQSANVDEKSKGFSCHPSSSPAKTKHVETSHGSTGTQKPTFILVQENGVVKAKKVLQVVKVVKPQIPACIKAGDVGSLLDQFLEYEQNQSSSVMIVKGSSVTLTPVSSPNHHSKSKFIGHDTGSSQPTTSPKGLSPPVSPPSESASVIQKVRTTPSPLRNVTPTKIQTVTTTPSPLKIATPTKIQTVTTTPSPLKNVTPNKNAWSHVPSKPSKASNSVAQNSLFVVSPGKKTATQPTTPSKNTTEKLCTVSVSKDNMGTMPYKTPSKNTVKRELVNCMEIDENTTGQPLKASNSNDKIATMPKESSKDNTVKVERENAMEIDENPGRSKFNNSNNNTVQTKDRIENKIDLSENKKLSQNVCNGNSPMKFQPSALVKSPDSNFKIPKRMTAEVDRKRRVSTEDEEDEENKNDYNDFKRKKYKRDECYWSSSEEESDDERTAYHKSKKTSESSTRTHPRTSRDDLKHKRSYSHRKYERRNERSQSPKHDSDEERHVKRQRRPDKKSPLKEDSEESNVHLFDIENERKKNFKLDRAIKETSAEKRKIVYIGNIDDKMSKSDIWSLFRKYGPIEKTTVHYRKDGDNYSFVTFVEPSSALEAIEEGKTDPDLKHLDICFGGRRKFCGGSYVDFDSTTSSLEEQQEREGSRKTSHSNEEMDFDMLLQMALKNKKR